MKRKWRSHSHFVAAVEDLIVEYATELVDLAQREREAWPEPALGGVGTSRSTM